MRGEIKTAFGQSRTARELGMAEWTPNLRASYKQAATTPEAVTNDRPLPAIPARRNDVDSRVCQRWTHANAQATETKIHGPRRRKTAASKKPTEAVQKNAGGQLTDEANNIPATAAIRSPKNGSR